MTQYRTFGSYLLYHEAAADALGHLYRAGEFDRGGVRRTAWLRVFDAPGLPQEDLRSRCGIANLAGEHLHAANVAAGVSCFAEDGVPALAFDYVPGQPLSVVFNRTRDEGFPVPVDNALLIIEKLALALSSALAIDVEGQSLIHGFLHPSLVVVSTDGEAVVSGFAMADQLLGALDRAETAAGTAPYLAPEVLVARSSSKRGDVYSMGAILYQLLTGEALPADPAARPAALDAAELAFDEGPIPADIMAVLRRALATRPEERFSSAADFKKELDKLLYGGAYSPTTFNLALFMDRLFRSDIEAEERARLEEGEVDVAAYLHPEPEPVEEEVGAPPPPSGGGGRGLWLALAAAALILGAGSVYLFLGRAQQPQPALAPTPTAEELQAQRDAEQAKLEAMVQSQVAQLMAEKEDSIRQELTARQSEIEKLQGRLKEMQKGSGNQLSSEQRQTQEQLQKQIAAAEEAKRKQEAALQQERQKRTDELREKLAAQPSPTPPAPAAAPEQAVPQAETAAATAPPKATAAPTATPFQVTENMELPATAVDTQPAVLKDQQVSWPRVAIYSRRRGVVIVQALVNANGRVDDVKVLRADDDGFGIPQAAMDAVRKYLFRPATKDGVKVKTTATVAIPYSFRPR